MTQHELVNRLADILEETKAGVLTTVDSEGRPHVRWMTPAVLRDRQSALFAVTCPDFSKTDHLRANPGVEWLFQSRRLDRVITVRGMVNVVDNPSLKNEVLEVLAPRLDVFWKVNCESSAFVVLETVIEEGIYYEPLGGIRDVVKFT